MSTLKLKMWRCYYTRISFTNSTIRRLVKIEHCQTSCILFGLACHLYKWSLSCFLFRRQKRWETNMPIVLPYLLIPFSRVQSWVKIFIKMNSFKKNHTKYSETISISLWQCKVRQGAKKSMTDVLIFSALA